MMAPYFYEPGSIGVMAIIRKVINFCKSVMKSSPASKAKKPVDAAVPAPRRPRQRRAETEAVSAPRATANLANCRIIPRAEHPISRRDISPNALKVLYRLKEAGYDAYLVGGCIRDLLLGITPKDFDVTTNATPEQVKRVFRNCRLIGRRFRLAHVLFGNEIIEVATFRGHHSDDDADHTAAASNAGQLLRDNVYGSIDEDAERRDFDINALYYSIDDFAIYDFANGYDAIMARRINMIGDPETRYREDPVRMLRAVRFATKLDMQIAPATEAPIKALAPLLANIPPARLFEEVLKLFLNGKAQQNFEMLDQYGIIDVLFPVLSDTLHDSQSYCRTLLLKMFANNDARAQQELPLSPSYLFAALLWYPVLAHAKWLMSKHADLPEYDAMNMAMNEVVGRVCQRVAVPKRFSLGARDIWQLQHRFLKRNAQRAAKLATVPKFRAAYDFLVLRAEVEQDRELAELASWWTRYQQVATEHERTALLKESAREQRFERESRGEREGRGEREPRFSQDADGEQGAEAGEPRKPRRRRNFNNRRRRKPQGDSAQN